MDCSYLLRLETEQAGLTKTAGKEGAILLAEPKQLVRRAPS